jgi:hypothetical protein
VNFGRRPWWSFLQKSGEKKLFPKEIILKKGKNLAVGQKFEINFFRTVGVAFSLKSF